MVKREFYDNLGYFDTSLRVDADYDFYYRLLIINNIRYEHIQKLGIISTSKGFSFQNRELAKKEAKLIRKKYFSNMYLVYNSFACTNTPLFKRKYSK